MQVMTRRAAITGPGAPLALAAAALFGASTPLAKLLLGEVAPWLAAAVTAGGVIAPVLLLHGLAQSSAAAAALLLNLEGLFSLAIAWLVFHENVDRRIALGAAAILGGATLLSWQPDLGAGAVNLALALLLGAPWPGAGTALLAGAVGLAGYGVSLVLFVLALRHLGTARTMAYFSTAPFIGAVLAVALLGEPVTATLLAAAALMGLGLWLHLAERHEHRHEHAPLAHEHRHVHDLHHRHDHRPMDPASEPHAHAHVHPRLVHGHPHYPDLHHRHEH